MIWSLVVGVEVRRRLVGEHQLRLGHQRAGDGDALPLPARELVRLVVEVRLQADVSRGLRDPLAQRLAGLAAG